MLGIIFIVAVAVIVTSFAPKEKKKCINCDSEDLIKSPDYGRSHEETWYICRDCQTFQD